MRKDQAEASAKLIQSVLPAQTSGNVFLHGDKTPAGYVLSIVKGSEQSVIHNVEGVADDIKKGVASGQAGATTKTATPGNGANHVATNGHGNGGQRA